MKKIITILSYSFVPMLFACTGQTNTGQPNTDTTMTPTPNQFIDSSYKADPKRMDSGMSSTNMLDSVTRNLKDSPATK